MANFALIDENNIVVSVIIADRDFIESGQVGDPTKWIEDTQDIHNDAGIGKTYDPVNRAFIDPKPYSSWILDNKFQWQAPIPKPTLGVYRWNENTITWDLAD